MELGVFELCYEVFEGLVVGEGDAEGLGYVFREGDWVAEAGDET